MSRKRGRVGAVGTVKLGADGDTTRMTVTIVLGHFVAGPLPYGSHAQNGDAGTRVVPPRVSP